MIITILKILAVALMLVAMVVILLGINHLFSGNFDTREKDTDKFREEVRDGDEVMSDHSVFRAFLGGDPRKD